MQEIQGQAKTVRQLMSVKYAIDYYQREYKWETKQIQELLDDLTEKFLEDYRKEHSPIAVKGYGRYFLGSIIISKKDDTSYIVDGQQRLTSLTLLLLFLRNQQKNAARQVAIDNLIYSEQYGTKSFNIDIDSPLPGASVITWSAANSISPDSRPEANPGVALSVLYAARLVELMAQIWAPLSFARPRNCCEIRPTRPRMSSRPAPRPITSVVVASRCRKSTTTSGYVSG